MYVELEAIALSRDIPGSLRWMVEPIVRRVSRSALVVSLQETADAVRSNTNITSTSSVGAASNGTTIRSAKSPASAFAGKGMHP